MATNNLATLGMIKNIISGETPVALAEQSNYLQNKRSTMGGGTSNGGFLIGSISLSQLTGNTRYSAIFAVTDGNTNDKQYSGLFVVNIEASGGTVSLENCSITWLTGVGGINQNGFFLHLSSTSVSLWGDHMSGGDDPNVAYGTVTLIAEVTPLFVFYPYTMLNKPTTDNIPITGPVAASATTAAQVANALSLVLNGGTTTYNGSEAQEVNLVRYTHNVTIISGNYLIKLAPIISAESSFANLSDIYDALADTKLYPGRTSYIATSIISAFNGGTPVNANLLLFTSTTTATVYTEQYDGNTQVITLSNTDTVNDAVTPF